MWIVRLALRRPYTFVVVSLLLLILGPIVILRTPTDIFPNINIPVVSIVWNYTGLNPDDMSNRIVFQTERALTTLVDDISHFLPCRGIGLRGSRSCDIESVRQGTVLPSHGLLACEIEIAGEGFIKLRSRHLEASVG